MSDIILQTAMDVMHIACNCIMHENEKWWRITTCIKTYFVLHSFKHHSSTLEVPRGPKSSLLRTYYSRSTKVKYCITILGFLGNGWRILLPRRNQSTFLWSPFTFTWTTYPPPHTLCLPQMYSDTMNYAIQILHLYNKTNLKK